MIRYIPFLKAKQGELNAVGELSPNVKQAICPFFDFPRRKPNFNADDYATRARRIATSLRKHWGTNAEFYFDDYDIEQTISIAGEHQYSYVLKVFADMQVIPVVALGRSAHNGAVAQLKSSGKIGSASVAFRAEQDCFEDFELNEDQIDYELSNVFNEFEEIDLILDCRVCTGMNTSETALQIADFATKFCSAYSKVRRVVVTGSSIPASLGEVVGTTSTKVLERRELVILAKAQSFTSLDLVGGDYATVSPFFSKAEFDPKLFPRVTSPRLIYSFNHSHFISRGSSLAVGGYSQYFELTNDLCARGFFRGRSYSAGDKYFYGKSQRMGNNATNATVVKPSVVAHITYMVLRAKS